MIRKILRWTGIVLGSLVGLLVLALVVLYIIGSAKWNQNRWNCDVPVETIAGSIALLIGPFAVTAEVGNCLILGGIC